MKDKSFKEKLVYIQTKLKAPKNQRNNFGNYNFRNKEDILEALKPLLEETELIVTVNDEIINVGKFNYVKATATITDLVSSLSATSSAREAEEQKGMNPAQITGSSNSYAGKYALGDLFLLDDTKDADATNTHGKDISAPKNITATQVAESAKKVQATTSVVTSAATQKSELDKALDTPAPEKKSGFGSRFAKKTEAATNDPAKKEVY